MGAEMAQLAMSKSKRVLWLAAKVELVEQAANALSSMGLPLGVICASSRMRIDPSQPAQCASIDTLIARKIFPAADLVILDEAHIAPARGVSEFLSWYRESSLIGLTATPQRGDGTGLGGIFASLVVAAHPSQLLELGFLVPMKIMRPARMLRPGQLAQDPVDAFTKTTDRQTIIFCGTVNQAHDVASRIGPNAFCVDSETPNDARSEAVERYRRGELRVLTNVSCLTEGVDLPSTSCIIIARGIGTPGLWLQTTGRGSRPAPGKTDCVVLDLRGVSHLHGHPYAERRYSLEGRGIAPLRANATDRWCRVCGAPVGTELMCVDCGIGIPERPVKVVGAKLSPYDWAGAVKMQGEDTSARAARLRAWRETARSAGHSNRWPYVRYRVVYGEAPSKEVVKASYGGS
jgi:DNA repair protein RadD